MNPPLISVIVPVYNAGPYLKQCLDTILGQTFRNIEVICVNDGSTDTSLEILNEYARNDERLAVMNQENLGMGAGHARNAGMRKARGDYLMFLDADDSFDLDLLKKLCDRAEETAADLVLCDTYTYYAPTGALLEDPHELYTEYLPATSVFSYADIPDHIFQIANAAPWHRLLRHAFVKELDLRFQESVPVIDDAFFILLLQLRAARIATVPERLVYYRMHNAHAQTSRISEYPDSAYRACFAVKQELQRIGLYPQVKQSFVNFAAKMLRWYLNSVKNWKTYEYLFTQYKTRYLQDLDITGHARSYFYFGGFCYDWCTDVLQKDAADVIFQYYCGFRAGADVINYAFPRGLIPDGSRLALYGAGQMGRSYRAQIPWLNQVALVAWVDQNYERLGPEVSDPASLQSVAFDAILIAIERVSTVQEVMASLSALGIPAGKMYHTNMRREDGK